MSILTKKFCTLVTHPAQAEGCKNRFGLMINRTGWIIPYLEESCNH